MSIAILLLTGNPAVDLVLNAYTGSKFYQTRDHASLRLRMTSLAGGWGAEADPGVRYTWTRVG